MPLRDEFGSLFEMARSIAEGEIPQPPVAQLIGFRLVSVEPGQAVLEMETDERHTNPMGTLHGGILCDIADAAMGLAYASTLEAAESFTTLELKINYLRPFWMGTLRAVGRVVQNGRLVGLTECDIEDEEGQLIARATSTCMTLRGDRARGR
ncbi:MAG: PaaI family thioesterase [Thermoplasmata archaeon]